MDSHFYIVGLVRVEASPPICLSDDCFLSIDTGLYNPGGATIATRCVSLYFLMLYECLGAIKQDEKGWV
jgi:hypothetical protein